MKLQDVADEIGVTEGQLVITIIGNRMPAYKIDGEWTVTDEVAERITTIYRNAGPSQAPRPTPMHLREEFTSLERAQARHDYIDAHGPTRGDRP